MRSGLRPGAVFITQRMVVTACGCDAPMELAA
jgi:hypothetical protein